VGTEELLEENQEVSLQVNTFHTTFFPTTTASSFQSWTKQGAVHLVGHSYRCDGWCSWSL